jgi:NADPH:quinone reductase-like Zn-dependent oxidoreductase
MGATHTIDHREPLPAQIAALKPKVPVDYILITHSTRQYLAQCAEIAAPLGKVCSVVQETEKGAFDALGHDHPFMAKSLSFHWELLGTKPYFDVDVNNHGRILNALKGYIEEGTIKCHLQKTMRLDRRGLLEGHELIEGGGVMGKVGLGIDVEDEKGEGGEAFTWSL